MHSDLSWIFRGGLNVDASPDMLADNELAVADNVNWMSVER